VLARPGPSSSPKSAQRYSRKLSFVRTSLREICSRSFSRLRSRLSPSLRGIRTQFKMLVYQDKVSGTCCERMFRGKFLAISSRVFPLSLSLSPTHTHTHTHTHIFCIACSLLCEACKLAASCFFVVLRFLFFLSRDCCAKTDQVWFADRFCPRGMECCSGGVFVSAILFPIFLESLSGVVKEDCS